MPIRKKTKPISDAELEALLTRFEASTTVDENGAINFRSWDFNELERILPDAFEVDPAFTTRQLRYLLREALWNCRKREALTTEKLLAEARRIAREKLARPNRQFSMWTKFRAGSMAFSEGFSLNCSGVSIESADQLPDFMVQDEYFLNGHGRIKPKEPIFFGHLIARCEAREEENAVTEMLDAVDLFMALFNMYEIGERRSFLSDDRWPEGKLWKGPYYFIFCEERFLGQEHVWYDPNFSIEAWNTFAPNMSDVLKIIPEVQRALTALAAHPMRDLLTKVLRLMQNAMSSRDQSYRLLRYWSALEQLYGEPHAREKSYTRIIQRATFAEDDKLVARWKLGHISRLRNEYVHAGENDDDLIVMGQYLRVLLSRHVNYLLFHPVDVPSHAHWLEIVDLPSDEASLTARKAVIDQRIALIRASQRRLTHN